jgi:hypothetical protein
MAIYRGEGGSGDATGDASNASVLATASAIAAANSASTALGAASSATSSSTTASTDAATATTQAGIATTQATNASTSAGTATTQATAATSSASSASTSATTATTQAGVATTQASLATTNGAAQVTLATAQVALATTQAGNAASSASTATTQAGISTTKAGESAASFTSMDIRFLGSKSANPTLNNTGGSLAVGALYYNTVALELRVYNGSIWTTAYLSSAAYVTLVGIETLTNKTLSGALVSSTPTEGDNTTLLASTAFVTTAILAAKPFPSGTRMSFQQTAAPTGWTKDVTVALNDSIMRIVTGTASSGGTTLFSTFNGQTTVGATTLSIAQMPSHTHTSSGFPVSSTNVYTSGAATTNNNFGTGTTGAQGGGGSHTHGITTAIKYYDFIIASKD